MKPRRLAGGGSTATLRSTLMQYIKSISRFLSGRRKYVLAVRNDGLGERLNAILNALWLAETYDLEFRFKWPSRFEQDQFHAIEPVEEIFDAGFIRKHLLTGEIPSKTWALEGSGLTASDLRKKLNHLDGLVAPRQGLDLIFDKQSLPFKRPNLSTSFKKIRFSRKIDAAIKAAYDIPLQKKSVGMHLRGGDVFYGQYRKLVFYTYKGITLPIAKAIIRELNKKDRAVCLFGQDKDVISYLCASHDAYDIDSIADDRTRSFGAAERAMFDLITLSRFRKIIAGSSGFAKQAAWVSGARIVNPSRFFDPQHQYDLAISDLDRHGSSYHPLQTAFAYWYAYFVGRARRPIEQNVFALKSAMKFDRDNELYPLVLSAIYYQNGFDDMAEELLYEYSNSGDDLKQRSLVEIFLARAGRYNLDEYHPHFEDAAKRGCSAAVMLVRHLHLDNFNLESTTPTARGAPVERLAGLRGNPAHASGS